MRLWRRIGVGLARGIVLVASGVLLLLIAASVILQTDWARNQLRGLIVSQANQYLTATLQIGRLNGSLFRGIELDDVRLIRQGETLVVIERLAVSYSLRELMDGGTVLRRLSLTRPRVYASRQSDGRWNLAALVRRDPERDTSGPGRPIRINGLEIIDGSVTIDGGLSLGAVQVPRSFTQINLSLAFAYRPAAWTLDVAHASFTGDEPELTVRELSGTVGDGDDGWLFRSLHVVTPRSDVTLDGRVDRSQVPPTLDLTVAAPRLAFQEWAGVLDGLGNLAVESAFDAHLTGPPAAVQTHIALRSTGGDVSGDLVLDSTVPGWHAKGNATVQRLDLARWLNRPDQPSDISGSVDLDIDLQLGGHFPRGGFAFRGPHVAYLEYEVDEVVARGTLTATHVQIALATATAYGANVRLNSGSVIAIDEPHSFRFIGAAVGVDLRQVPGTVPVPHVESSLAFDYDIAGQFASPFIRGHATFADSAFLGAHLGAGATGSIDTQRGPVQFAGEGDLRDVNLNQFGHRLELHWLADPRYDGTLAGHFHVDGVGSDAVHMTLTGGGRLEEADVFGGRLSDADVSVAIRDGSLTGTYDGSVLRIDPAIPMADASYSARLTGKARGEFAVRDALVRPSELKDYTVHATIQARDSVVRGIDVTRGDVQMTLADGTMHLDRLVSASPGVDLEASGTLELDGVRDSVIDYHATSGDLSLLSTLLGRDVTGQAATSGRLTGPLDRMRFAGTLAARTLALSGFAAATTTASYDVTIPIADPMRAVGHATTQLATVLAFGRAVPSVDATLAYDAGRITAQIDSVMRDGLPASLAGTFVLDAEARTLDAEVLSLAALRTSWRLAGGTRSRLTWSATGVGIEALDLVDAATGQQHLLASGTWDQGGGGELRLTARDVSVGALTAGEGQPVQYGGVLSGTALVAGTLEHPLVSADFVVAHGRLRRLAYETFSGHIDYRDDGLQLDVRLDQAPGVWLTGVGSVPLSVLDRTAPAQPIHLAIKSSPISLSLLEGVTDVVRNVGGQMTLDLVVLGTNQDPHFAGRADLTTASFDVVASGGRYRNGRLALLLASDRVAIETFHIEDESGRPLDVTGSLGTHELRIGDLQVTITARGFQVLRNDFGRVNVDAQLNLAGQFESPTLTGRLTVTGGSLNVDQILARTLFQPYSTEATHPTDTDVIAALSPWERMGMNLELRVPGTLRMIGENVQVSPGTPLGLGDVNLRAFGELYLYKDPSQPMYVTGSFDTLTGAYVFQGRRFDLDSSSSITFLGDLNPELYVTVRRVISGVEARVSMVGPLTQPELRLASTPPLDPSEVLSLIVFNTSTNQLSALQQQSLAVRAGTLAAGFIAAPMVSALERTLGIDSLEIDPGSDATGGPRVSVGNEFARGLTARFSRQFGEYEYDEATLEYLLSRILRIRATFSDAGALTDRSPFRRVERAGVDLMFFFSF